MQLTTMENMASGAALLSQEQLQALARTAKILSKGMEEVTWDVTNYLKQLQDLMPTALEAATNEAVKQWINRVAEAEVVAAYWVSTIGQTALKLAQQDRENPVDRAIQILELTLAMSCKPWRRWRTTKSGLRLGGRRGLRRNVTPWRLSSSQPGPPGRTHPSPPGRPRYAPSLMKCLSAGQVIEDQSTVYTLEEVDEALQLLAKHGQWR